LPHSLDVFWKSEAHPEENEYDNESNRHRNHWTIQYQPHCLTVSLTIANSVILAFNCEEPGGVKLLAGDNFQLLNWQSQYLRNKRQGQLVQLGLLETSKCGWPGTYKTHGDSCEDE
jgi:hypothetical protein